MAQKQKIAFHTLGCKLNYAETATLSSLFDKDIYEHVPFSQQADVYVINTCSVTEQANKKCRQSINKAVRTSPGAKVAVVGCFAQLKANEIAEMNGVTLVLGTKEKFNIVKYLESNTSPTPDIKVHSCEIDEVTQYAGSFSLEGRTRSFLKVQDGCDYNCSYCTIPLARGKSRNPAIDDIVAQARIIEQKGIKEIILTGVNIGEFKTANGERFFDLLKALEANVEVPRFRISSIEPNLLTDEIVDWIALSTKFVPHFHIPLQSGSNNVLRLMRRRYNAEMFAKKVAKIRSVMPNCGIGIDVIVGTPGETNEYFEDCFSFLETIDFSYLHVFSYSPRENTDALAIEPKVLDSVKSERSKRLHELSDRKTKAFYERQLGEIHQVLFEQKNNLGFIHGFTQNYIKVEYPFTKSLINVITDVALQSLQANGTVLGSIKS
jgi:threonylcarbamoyladenosine tRNA methylthiotransferase MtaB